MEATIPATPTTLLPVQPGPAATRPIYAIEAFASMGGTLFTVGIFFYTHKRFGWGTAENFTLAATQGAV